MLLLLFLAAAVFILWRFWFFFRNPPRVIPTGNSMVSPADGYVVYVRRVKAGEEAPVAIKKGCRITLSELTASGELAHASGFIVGIFMTPFSVHYNRIPLSGEVTSVYGNKPAGNQTMARMIFNLILGKKVPETGCTYLLTNERKTTVIHTGRGSYSITQIADVWVSQIVNNLSTGDKVTRGEPFGMIRFGSQTDIFIPDETGYFPVCTPGEYVYAGESIIASY